jgi:hypothetical protein
MRKGLMIDEDSRPAHELDLDEPASAGSESDEHSGSQRHRRPVADWGGDELFNHVPRRRFARTGVAPHTRRPSASPITSHQLRRNAGLGGGTPVHSADLRASAESRLESGAVPLSALPGEPLITIYEPDSGSDATGALAAERLSAPRDRRRARRSVDERVGPRPDRIAALAFVLGLLLVLLAVATADAAALAF